MLKKKDLEQQTVFSEYKDGCFYDSNSEYVICFEGGKAVLYEHCEVNGILEPIKDLMSLEDLLNTIDILNIT